MFDFNQTKAGDKFSIRTTNENRAKTYKVTRSGAEGMDLVGPRGRKVCVIADFNNPELLGMAAMRTATPSYNIVAEIAAL